MMFPGLYLEPPPGLHAEISNEEEGHVDGLQAGEMAAKLAVASYQAFPLLQLPTWDFTVPTLFSPPMHFTSGQCKKLRAAADEPYKGNGDGEDLAGDRLRKLRFRDHIGTYKRRFWAADTVEHPIECCGDGGAGDEIRLVQQLISCAEAVACRDRAQASLLLSELRGSAMVLGSAFQRVASCFVQGLAERLAHAQPLAGGEGGGAERAPEGWEEALELAYEACPYIQFGHFVANAAILEAFEGETHVHVVDLGMTMALPQGQQWRLLVDALAAGPGGPPKRVRITGVGSPGARFRAIGRELEEYARGAGVNLEFTAVERSLENLQPGDLRLDPGEALAVSSVLQLHRAVKESRGALNAVLKLVRALEPRALAVVEQDANHNGPFFLGRFMEALHYYSAVFDSLDAALPRYDTRRAKVEQFYIAEEIKNIVSCEGPARVERHERVDQWRRRMSRAGFQAAPLRMLARAREWLEEASGGCEGYTVAEEKGCLVIGWMSRPILAASCWKC